MANGIIVGVHNVFPVDEDDNEDLLSLKKMKKLESMWALEKDILGFTFDGKNKTIMLDKTKRDSLLAILHGWIRHGPLGAGIPFNEFQSVISKLRHAFIAIPSGKGLLSPCNTVLRKQPSLIFLHRNDLLLTALSDCRTLLRESTMAPTKCSELVAGWPDFVGVKDASGHGVGGVVVGENEAYTPTVF